MGDRYEIQVVNVDGFDLLISEVFNEEGERTYLSTPKLRDLGAAIEAGEYDFNPPLRLRMVATWVRGADLSPSDSLVVLREFLAVSVCHWLVDVYGGRIFEHQGVTLNLDESVIRAALMTQVDGVAIQMHGKEEGTRMAISLYLAMKSDQGGLSDFGVEIIKEMLEDSVDYYIKNGCRLMQLDALH